MARLFRCVWADAFIEPTSFWYEWRDGELLNVEGQSVVDAPTLDDAREHIRRMGLAIMEEA